MQHALVAVPHEPSSSSSVAGTKKGQEWGGIYSGRARPARVAIFEAWHAITTLSNSLLPAQPSESGVEESSRDPEHAIQALSLNTILAITPSGADEGRSRSLTPYMMAAAARTQTTPSLSPRHSPLSRSSNRRSVPDTSTMSTITLSNTHALDHATSIPTPHTSAPATSTSPPAASQVASSFSKQASHSVTPFLTKHIPNQYNPLGGSGKSQVEDNTKYCYRHRKDLKCRRQVNEPSMDQLQQELGHLPSQDQEGIANVWSHFAAAPAKCRQLMLQGILAQCCFPQLSFVSASVRELIKIDFLTALPTELGLKVLCYLDPTSICKAAQVSERWRMLADDDVVWHRMCEQHIDRKCTKCGWGLPLLDQKRLRTEKRQIQLRAQGRSGSDDVLSEHIIADDAIGPESELDASEVADDAASHKSKRSRDEDGSPSEMPAKRICSTSPAPADEQDGPRLRPWKDVYRDRFKVGTNWKHGRFSIKTFKGHSNGVTCLQFDDSLLVTGSYDATIKFWDINTCKELRTLRGHAGGIRCLQYEDNVLVSGSLDGTVKMWDMTTGRIIRTLQGHQGGVISLHYVDKSIIATGSQDNTIRVWCFTDRGKYVLRGHTDWVNSVKVHTGSRTIVSASDDMTVRLWDLDTKACLKVYEGHVAPVQQVLFLPPEFELDGDDHDHHTSPADAEDGTLSARKNLPRYMMTASLDTTIRLWSVRTGECIRVFFGHIEGVWGLAVDTLRMVSVANDNLVKIWDPRSGVCEGTFAQHTRPVTCVGLSDSKMCTGSEDNEAKLYSF
ncbi:hypothetical protein MRB53_039293 [Persea americana]|nr:hypothetical protein MRB53_039293 [Persea americana]